MANTLTNFMVGIGLDDTQFKRGQKEVVSGIGNIRSQVLQLGAVAGGALGINALTMGFADATAEVGRFTQVFGGTAEDIRAMGQALEQEGGSLESFMSQIENLERLRAMTPGQLGGLFAEAGIRGLDPSVVLNAESATDAFVKLADVMARLPARQRLNMADVFQLDESSIRLLSKGRDEVERLVDIQREIRPLTEDMTEAGIAFNQQLATMKNNIGGIADEVSMKLVPVLTTAFSLGNEAFAVQREQGLLAIPGETFAGGRLSATGIMGDSPTAQFLDKPIAEHISELTQDNPLLRALIPSALQFDGRALFGGDAGAMPASTPSMALPQGNAGLTSPHGAQQPIQVQMTIENTMQLDGQVLDQRIDQRNETVYSQALTEVTSSNQG